MEEGGSSGGNHGNREDPRTFLDRGAQRLILALARAGPGPWSGKFDADRDDDDGWLALNAAGAFATEYSFDHVLMNRMD